MKTNTTSTPKFKPSASIPLSGPIKDISSGRAEVFKLDPRLLSRQEGFNARYDYGDIEALAKDIEANGVLEALKVRKVGSHVLVINGDRRLTAIELLLSQGRWPEDPVNKGYPMPIPCTSEGKGVSDSDRIFMMLSLNTGKPFTMLEKAIAYKQAMEADPSINGSEIARRTGETKQAVSNALHLIQNASPLLIKYIKQDKISATAALGIIKSTFNHEQQDEAVTAAILQASESGKNHALPKHIRKPPKNNNQSGHNDSSEANQSHSEPEPDPDPEQNPGEPTAENGNQDGQEPPQGKEQPQQSEPFTPPDPSSYQKLKNAPSSNRDGSSQGPSQGSGYANADKRIKNMETMLDELNPDACIESRWETVELILDYLQGNHSIAVIKSHLKK